MSQQNNVQSEWTTSFRPKEALDYCAGGFRWAGDNGSPGFKGGADNSRIEGGALGGFGAGKIGGFGAGWATIGETGGFAVVTGLAGFAPAAGRGPVPGFGGITASALRTGCFSLP